MATQNSWNNETPNLAAHGLIISQAIAGAQTELVLTAGQIPIGTTASDPVGATLTSGAGISITSVTGAITIAATGGGLTWSTITAGTSSPAVDSGTVANHAATPLVMTLPATAAVGSAVAVQGLAGSGGWTLTANTGQTIQFGNQSTSSGGSWSSTNAGDAMYVVCVVANTTWAAMSVISAGLTRV